MQVSSEVPGLVSEYIVTRKRRIRTHLVALFNIDVYCSKVYSLNKLESMWLKPLKYVVCTRQERNDLRFAFLRSATHISVVRSSCSPEVKFEEASEAIQKAQEAPWSKPLAHLLTWLTFGLRCGRLSSAMLRSLDCKTPWHFVNRTVWKLGWPRRRRSQDRVSWIISAQLARML